MIFSFSISLYLTYHSISFNTFHSTVFNGFILKKCQLKKLSILWTTMPVEPDDEHVNRKLTPLLLMPCQDKPNAVCPSSVIYPSKVYHSGLLWDLEGRSLMWIALILFKWINKTNWGILANWLWGSIAVGNTTVNVICHDHYDLFSQLFFLGIIFCTVGIWNVVLDIPYYLRYFHTN